MTRKLTVAQRLLDLPPYLFKEIDDRKRALIAAGRTLLNFGIGDPDQATPRFIVDSMAEEMGRTVNQKYPDYEGCATFRRAVTAYMRSRFDVALDPDREVMALIGSKEGLAHFSWAFIDPGDIALVPDPGYPVYQNTTRFAGGEVFSLPLLPENGFFPDLDRIPPEVEKRAKVIYVNYPNNPTGTVVSRERLTTLVEWARQRRIIIVSDAAYAELVYDPADRFSLLSLPGAREVAIEFHSFSKTFNMTGWRVGFAVGNPELIGGLLKMKTNVDSGVFDAIQLASAAGLQKLPLFIDGLVATYRERRDALVTVLQRRGYTVFPSGGAFYVWMRCPAGFTSKEFTLHLMDKTGVVTTPGSGFGSSGEGFTRFALTQPLEKITALDDALGKLG